MSLTPLLRYYGGKSILASRIINLMPDTEGYVEGYCGGLSILINKRKCRRECANDIDKDLIRFYRFVQSYPKQILLFLKGYDFSETSFDDAEHLVESEDPVEYASGYLIRNRMSYGGLGNNYTWSDELRRDVPRFISTWNRVLEETFPLFADRIKNVLFVSMPAVKLLTDTDWANDTLFYLDPPYIEETRVARNMYKHEMTYVQHVELMDTIANHRSHIFLSGYHHKLYDERLANWTCKEYDVSVNIPIKGQQSRRTECLWMNRPSMLQLFRMLDDEL